VSDGYRESQKPAAEFYLRGAIEAFEAGERRRALLYARAAVSQLSTDDELLGRDDKAIVREFRALAEAWGRA